MGVFRCSYAFAAPPSPTAGRRHEPYLWDCLPSVFRTPLPLEAAILNALDCKEMLADEEHLYLVRFTCHVEFLHSAFPVTAGSLVVVDGERGVDVGTVVAPGSTDVKPVPRPGIKRGDNYYRTCLGLARPDLRAARGQADFLSVGILHALRSRAQSLGRRFQFLGVEVQADLQYAVVYYHSPCNEVLCRQEFVPRLFATFRMRFWLENVERMPYERRIAPRKPNLLGGLFRLMLDTPRVPSCGGDDNETDDDEELLLPPLPVGVSRAIDL